MYSVEHETALARALGTDKQGAAVPPYTPAASKLLRNAFGF